MSDAQGTLIPSVCTCRRGNVGSSPPKLTAALPPSGLPIAEPSYVSVDDMRRRKNKAVKAAKQEIAQIGVGVTPEAQQLFDSLAKTMNCRWDGQSIVVFDMVTIR